jgi:L-alanine-DL-glutamate epimerase-like enolase superfamily enzyme
MPWLMRLFREVPLPQNGELVMPTKPGLGLEFDPEALRKFGTT